MKYNRIKELVNDKVMFYISNTITVLLVLLFFAEVKFAQSTQIASSIVNSNNIQTIVWNYGSISRPGAINNIEDFVYNKLGYMYEFGIFVSAEVINKNGDTLHISSDSFISTSEGDYSPDGKTKWGWLPESGYHNISSSKIASSNESETWPVNWNNWPGEYGEGKIIANNELYYAINDYSNKEYDYMPFDSDSSRRGIGLKAEVRVYQFPGTLKDALIVKYFLTNQSDNDLSKVYFGFKGDPHIGGSYDQNDDIVRIVKSNYDSDKILKTKTNNTIYLFDKDNLGMVGKVPKILSFKFLKTPNDLGLTSFVAPQWSTFDVKDDESIWEFFNNGIDTVNYLYNKAGDNEILFGTGPFSLKKNETKQIGVALFISETYNDLLEDATTIDLHSKWDLIESKENSQGGNEEYKINLHPIVGKISGNYEIKWSHYESSSSAKIFLEYSCDKGKDWTPLAVNLNIDSFYNWDISNNIDGKNYLIRAIAYNEVNPEHYYYSTSNLITLDNVEFNAKPELELLTDLNNIEISKVPIEIKWISEDADNDSLILSIVCKNKNNGFSTVIKNTILPNGENSFLWYPNSLANGSGYTINITATDWVKDSTVISPEFSINIFDKILSPINIVRTNGNSTPTIEVFSTDETVIKNEEYSIKFHVKDEIVSYDVKNITTNKLILENYKTNEYITSPLIDGIKIKVIDNGIDIDYTETKYISKSSNKVKYNFRYPSILGTEKVKLENDYLLVFDNTDTLFNCKWSDPNIINTLLGEFMVPFTIWKVEGTAPNFDIKEGAQYIIFEDNSLNMGMWDWEESIIFQPQGTTNPITSYQLYFDIKNGDYPQTGDSLYIITFKSIKEGDEFRFILNDNFVVSVEDELPSTNFELYQNYPNPFNPITKIKYSIPSNENGEALNVKLVIFDILGREVTKLVNQKVKPGNYEVEFNAGHLSSGIYFYKIEMRNYISTKKMMLLK